MIFTSLSCLRRAWGGREWGVGMAEHPLADSVPVKLAVAVHSFIILMKCPKSHQSVFTNTALTLIFKIETMSPFFRS